jgi:hypothetical protein
MIPYVIADEMWNWTDGKRTVNEISAGIGAEFDFDLESRHILKLFQGFESKGLISFI